MAEEEKAVADSGRVILFRGISPAGPLLISQDTLREEVELRFRVHRALRELAGKRAQVRRLLDRGLPVEPGLYSARIEPRHRSAYDVASLDYSELVIR